MTNEELYFYRKLHTASLYGSALAEERKLVKAKVFCRGVWNMRRGEVLIVNPHYLTHTSNEWLHYFQRPEYQTLKLIGAYKTENGTVLYVYRKVRGI